MMKKKIKCEYAITIFKSPYISDMIHMNCATKDFSITKKYAPELEATFSINLHQY